MPHAEDFQIKYNVQGKVSFRVCSIDSLSAIFMLRNCSIFTKIKILDVIYDASTALGSVTAWDGTTAASHTLQVWNYSRHVNLCKYNLCYFFFNLVFACLTSLLIAIYLLQEVKCLNLVITVLDVCFPINSRVRCADHIRPRISLFWKVCSNHHEILKDCLRLNSPKISCDPSQKLVTSSGFYPCTMWSLMCYVWVQCWTTFITFY